MSRTLACLVVLGLAPLALAADVLVVAPDALRDGLTEWTRHRGEQGTHVVVVAPGEDVRATIRALATADKSAITHVLLAGDVDVVPCAYRPAVAIAPWETDTRIATDAPFADLDDDGRPDLAIGRIPARTAAELRAVLARSIAYEASPPPGDWRRRLSIVAGVGGFGGPQDMALEMLTRMILSRDVPGDVDAAFTFAKETSPFCPPPDSLQQTFIDQVSGGALVVAYVGHGSARHLDRMRWRGTSYPILEASAAPRIRCASGAPLVAMIACSTGKYDSDETSLAEELVLQPEGPAAVLASSRVSTPYGNAIFALEMLASIYGDGPPTVGEIVRDAKRRLGDGDTELPSRRALEAMAASFYEADPEKRAIDRSEHVLLYQLFGDPLLRLARPRRVDVLPPASVVAGGEARVAVTSPIAGRVRLELVGRRDRNGRPRPPGRSAAEMASDFALTRNAALATTSLDFDEPGVTVAVTLAIAADIEPGPHVVRVFVESTDGQAAAGSATIRVTRPR